MNSYEFKIPVIDQYYKHKKKITINNIVLKIII